MTDNRKITGNFAAFGQSMIIVAQVATWATVDSAHGQSTPQSYGQYYSSNAPKTPNMISPTHYLYNKYFYHSPSVSPYVNLDRRDSQSGDAYSTWVQPELARRQNSAQTSWSQSHRPNSAANNYGLAAGGNPGRRPKASAASPYYNQYYRKPARR
jgi:hypothetical protein